MYPLLWKLSVLVEKVFRVYLYFNVNLFSSEEDKYNLLIILKGAGKNPVLLLIVMCSSVQISLFCAFSRFFRAGFTLGDWSLRKMDGWWTKLQIQGRKCAFVSFCLDSDGFGVTWALISPHCRWRNAEWHKEPPLSAWNWEMMKRDFVQVIPCEGHDLVWVISVWLYLVNILIICVFFPLHVSFLIPDLELASQNEYEQLWNSFTLPLFFLPFM